MLDGTSPPDADQRELVLTRLTAVPRARHWTVDDCEAHAKMGFHEGWGIATDQLAALAATL